VDPLGLCSNWSGMGQLFLAGVATALISAVVIGGPIVAILGAASWLGAPIGILTAIKTGLFLGGLLSMGVTIATAGVQAQAGCWNQVAFTLGNLIGGALVAAIAGMMSSGGGSGGSGGGGGARGSVVLFHGTTGAGARSILSGGLLPVSQNTAPFPSGSFFTHTGAQGQIAASHWAARSASLHGGNPVLLRGVMSQELFNSLNAQGLIQTGPVPGLPFFPPQTVILPNGLGAAGRGIQWSIAPLMF